MANDKCILELKGITKRFPGVIALEDVDFSLKKGEVHALVGENGAGKSTLIKVLMGNYPKEAGKIIIEDSIVEPKSPKDSLDFGIGAIYQESTLIPGLSIGENIFLGNITKRGQFLFNKRKISNKSKDILEKLGSNLNPAIKVNSLNSAQCKIVEIAKVISRDVKVIILDEPTAALPEKESDMLFDLIRSLKERGIAIIYISHYLDEIFMVADRVTVIRNGKNVGNFLADEKNRENIIQSMVGRKLEKLYPKIDIQRGDLLLEVKSLMKKKVFKNISFSLSRGEILGFFGLQGSGHESVIKSLYGDLIPDSGVISIKGNKKRITSPVEAKRNGIGLVPFNRKKDGLILEHSILENISLGNIGNFLFIGFIKKGFERFKAKRWIKKLNIITSGLIQKVKNLSGGNQQKAIIARMLESNADILILEGPTVGVDIGARVEIYKILEEQCKSGKGIIMISEDIMETLSMSDRIIVIKDGEITSELEGKLTSKEEILSCAI